MVRRFFHIMKTKNFVIYLFYFLHIDPDEVLPSPFGYVADQIHG